MNIHEYQAKELLAGYGVSVPAGLLVANPDEAEKLAVELALTTGGNTWVIKAQVHAGGRGKGGGIKLAKDLAEVKSLVAGMIGMVLVTHQTGPAGKLVKKGADTGGRLLSGREPCKGILCRDTIEQGFRQTQPCIFNSGRDGY
jgi:succinyl-CoA synthetase beta subunit